MIHKILVTSKDNVDFFIRSSGKESAKAFIEKVERDFAKTKMASELFNHGDYSEALRELTKEAGYPEGVRS